MKLADCSLKLLHSKFEYWEVDNEYQLPIENYLLYGFNPGNFFSNVLYNDFFGAMVCSHPMNTVEALKRVVKFILNCLPVECYGSPEKFNNWLSMDENTRRSILEKRGLIYSKKDEMWKILND